MRFIYLFINMHSHIQHLHVDTCVGMILIQKVPRTDGMIFNVNTKKPSHPQSIRPLPVRHLNVLHPVTCNAITGHYDSVYILYVLKQCSQTHPPTILNMKLSFPSPTVKTGEYQRSDHGIQWKHASICPPRDALMHLCP
jgi:hypothetical protein